MAEGKRTPHLPPDDSFEPEMTGMEAFSRAMLIKLRTNRALRASESESSTPETKDK